MPELRYVDADADGTREYIGGTVFSVVATFVAKDPDAVSTEIAQALSRLGATLVPCHWSPDPDTVEEACRVPFGTICFLDMNPDFTDLDGPGTPEPGRASDD